MSQERNHDHRTERQEERSRPRRRRRRLTGASFAVCYALGVITASVLLACIGWVAANDMLALNKKPKTVTMTITADDSFRDVTNRLEDEGLIEFKSLFKLFAMVTGGKDKVTMGTYTLNTDMDYRALLAGMSVNSATKAEVSVTIPEGYTVSETIKLLAKNGVSTEEKLLEAAANASFNYNYINNNTKDINRLEGYLFPDTYEFYVNEKPANALGRLISNFDRKMDEEHLDAIEASGRSMKEIITIASLIEKETDGTDQAKIASVIYNRLNGPGDKAGTYGMLQVYASLLYALPDHTGPITNADKATDSKYNLYKYAGLPPTAIANPGVVAIDAALHPESTDYYYYALGKDGKHRFFTNYNDHLDFVNSNEYIGK